jgi:hypothetical protein
MSGRQPRLCRDCKFCLCLFDYEAESYSLFCDNLSTKEMNPPIGFLGLNDKECGCFELAQVEPLSSPPSDNFNTIHAVDGGYFKEYGEHRRKA